MFKEKINDTRLHKGMNRVRSGSTQVFTDGDVKMELTHERREMYASLIDGEWYWVSGCGPCNGEARGSRFSYIECEAHDVCCVCGIKSKDLAEGVDRWGGGDGWTCGICHDAEMKRERDKAFRGLDGEEPDCIYTDKIICPHCGTECYSEDVHENTSMECHVCQGEMEVEVEWTPSYSTKVIGDRITS